MATTAQLHPAIEARCRAVIATADNEELRKAAERLIANGGKKKRASAPQAAAAAAPVGPDAAPQLDTGPAGLKQVWTCTSCTLVNDESARTCAACATRRQASKPAWVCAACSVENAGSAAYCATCEQPRARAGKEAAQKRRREAPAWDDHDENDEDFAT